MLRSLAFVALPLAVGASLLLGGCAGLAASPAPSPPAVTAPEAPEVAAAGTAQATNRLTMIYEKPTDPSHQEVYDVLRRSKVFDELARDLNESFVFPCPLPVRFTACDEENAFYDPEAREISMCYELIDKYRLIYTDETSSPEEVEAEVVNAALFTFYHELGHALVDLYELPITGKEEDAVDEFASIILIDYGGEAGEEALLAAADQFSIDAAESAEETQQVEDLAYWDVHSLDQQRLYNVLCLIYGSNPEKYAGLVDEGDLPEDRAGGCEEEYDRASRVWAGLLAPYLRQ